MAEPDVVFVLAHLVDAFVAVVAARGHSRGSHGRSRRCRGAYALSEVLDGLLDLLELEGQLLLHQGLCRALRLCFVAVQVRREVFHRTVSEVETQMENKKV
jgi:hypothetical protein